MKKMFEIPCTGKLVRKSAKIKFDNFLHNYITKVDYFSIVPGEVIESELSDEFKSFFEIVTGDDGSLRLKSKHGLFVDDWTLRCASFDIISDLLNEISTACEFGRIFGGTCDKCGEEIIKFNPINVEIELPFENSDEEHPSVKIELILNIHLPADAEDEINKLDAEVKAMYEEYHQKYRGICDAFIALGGTIK